MNTSEFIDEHSLHQTITADSEHELRNSMHRCASKLAAQHAFFQNETSYFYAFKAHQSATIMLLEYDILDQTADQLALECYAYTRETNQLLAKSFMVFKKT